jgi:hypothetical protein
MIYKGQGFLAVVDKLSLIFSITAFHLSSLLTEKGEAARSQIIRSRKSPAIYISLNTLP